MMDPLQKLIELAEKLPPNLTSDWDGTNHFELTTETDEYWWLVLRDLGKLSFESELGKRVGLIMDIAATLQQALPQLKKE